MEGVVRKFWTICAALMLASGYAYADTPGVFTGYNASQLIAEALSKAGAGNDVHVRINEVREDGIVANASSPITGEVDNLSFDDKSTVWRAVLLLKTGDKNLAPVVLTGNYDVIKQIPVLTHTVRADEVISADDIRYEKQSDRFMRNDIITDTKMLIGKSPRHAISQNRPIRQDEIENAALMHKGARVTMLYRSGNLEIRTIGQALDNGAKGDIVRVKNLSSKSVIDATVETSDLVRVSPPGKDTAGTM
ncbi:MAG TPA: flagellar basal body P-ring formation chaperone FlgA [Rickettsiales bacterium]|nr:flagellar basal body P-ring formation chaperone FlgA [Rickettsiales bacterium]